MDPATVEVSYLELRASPTAPAAAPGPERIAVEALGLEDYLALYRQVGAQVRWDQRLRMPAAELAALLGSGRLRLYVLRAADGTALGLCEFDRGGFPEVELKNFGLVPAAQGRGLGRWLLASSLGAEWRERPARIWLHTDSWDHPAAVPLYLAAGFRLYDRRREPVSDL